MMSRRILYVIGSLGLGGAESQLTLLILECQRQNWHCELFVLDANGPFKVVLERQGIPIYDGGYISCCGFFKKIKMLVKSSYFLWQVIRSTKPDLIHTFLPLTNFIGTVIGRLAGIKKIISSKRALNTHQDRHKLWKCFDRLSNALSSKITVNSKAVWKDTIARDRVNPKKLVLIYNGLNIGLFKNIEKNRVIMRQHLNLAEKEIGIIMVANLIPYKGHADLLDAVSLIFPKCAFKIKVYFVGEDRGLKSQLEEKIQNLGIFNHVIFLGYCNNVPELLAAMDIYVMASHEEGFSNALLEAMAAGLPIIATDVGGNSEALANGEAGVLVPKCSPKMLAEALMQFIHSPEKRDYFAAQAKKNIGLYFSIEEMARQYLSLYSETKKA